MVVVGEEVEHGLVGGGDVLLVAGERGPAERALALAEQRPDVCRDEAGELKGPVVAALAGLVTDAVAVVEDLAPASMKPTIASTCRAIDSCARSVNSSGFFSA
ncbi:hypothetical protein BJF80_04710 [Serinicoccus sp. CUA-874]|nr:hypothetical protein BJF80_04710 [Serinicoccus sp. CUA-874]